MCVYARVTCETENDRMGKGKGKGEKGEKGNGDLTPPNHDQYYEKTN